MDKIIYFNNDNQRKDYCVGQTYCDFLDYAFKRTDYFMLLYANYYGKGYTKIMKHYRKALQPFEVKNRSNASWPGTLEQFCQSSTYKVIFYQNNEKAKEILKTVSGISEWTCPSHTQDLAFFKGNICWSYSVGHEKIAAIIHATKEDLEYVEKLGLASKENAYTQKNNYFDAYNEQIE